MIPVSFPGEDVLGKTWPEVVESARWHFGENSDISQNCSVENKTTENGTEYTEAVITGVPQQEDGTTADQYYYLIRIDRNRRSDSGRDPDGEYLH